MQRRLCHRTHQRPAHPRPASAGARYLIHLIQCPLGKMARCKAANVKEEVGCKHARERAEDLFSAGEVQQAVMNVAPSEQLWEFFYIVCTAQPLMHHILIYTNDK